MMTGLSRTAAFVLRHLVFNLQVAMEYRVSFAVQVVFMIVNDILLLFFWWILFQQIPDVGGWTRRETMLLIGVCAASFGVAAVLTGNVFRLSRLIAEGQLDVYLLLLRDPLLHALVGRTVVAGVGDLLFGMGCIWVLGPDSWTGQLLVGLAVLASAMTFLAFGIMAHALALWIGNASGLASFLHESLLALGMYSESIYPHRMRVLLYTALPVGFFVHVPVHLARHPDPLLLLLGLAFGVLMLRLAHLMFSAGLRSYQSGNLLTGRT